MITSEADSYLLQDDLNNVELCSKKWLLQLHPEKCKVVHTGHSYQTIYNGRTQNYENFTTGRRRVHTTSDLKSNMQCNKAANKAMSVLRMVNRAFKIMDKQEFLVIYQSFCQVTLGILCTELESTFGQGRGSTGEGSKKGNKVC